MKKLTNTPEDRKLVHDILTSGIFPKATFSLGCFTSELASSLTTIEHKGFITEIDLNGGYCRWKNENNREMFAVNINCITLN